MKRGFPPLDAARLPLPTSHDVPTAATADPPCQNCFLGVLFVKSEEFQSCQMCRYSQGFISLTPIFGQFLSPISHVFLRSPREKNEQNSTTHTQPVSQVHTHHHQPPPVDRPKAALSTRCVFSPLATTAAQRAAGVRLLRVCAALVCMCLLGAPVHPSLCHERFALYEVSANTSHFPMTMRLERLCIHASRRRHNLLWQRN